ncbi:unnamed protein product, partial [Ectocarpus fasciculatus]
GACSSPPGPRVMPYRYLEDSCVRYEEGDALGQLLAYCSLGHIFVVIAYITLIVAVRDIHVRCPLCCGACVPNGRPCLADHRGVRHPTGRREADLYTQEGSGMPSNHSQFLFFFAVFHALCLCL